MDVQSLYGSESDAISGKEVTVDGILLSYAVLRDEVACHLGLHVAQYMSVMYNQ